MKMKEKRNIRNAEVSETDLKKILTKIDELEPKFLEVSKNIVTSSGQGGLCLPWISSRLQLSTELSALSTDLGLLLNTIIIFLLYRL
jgi:hypothetical protein